MSKQMRQAVIVLTSIVAGLLVLMSSAPSATVAFSGGLSISGAEIWTQAQSNLTGISPEKDDQFGGVKDGQGDTLFADTLASGDFDGDGFFDLAIGTPYEDVGGKSDAGMVVVLYSDGPLGIWTNGYQAIDLGDGNLPGNSANNYFGAWMVTGDFDNDGYDDLAISAGAAGFFPSIQKLYILPGGSSGLSRNTFQTVTIDSIGWDGALATGDLNGDNYDDLAVSSPTFGEASLYWGSGTGLVDGGCPNSSTYGCPTTFSDDDLISELGLTNVKVPGVDKSLFGNSLAIGDLDNDGYDDLAIGDPYADAEANCVDVAGVRVDCDEGGVYVIYGSASLDDSGGSWSVSGEFVHQEDPYSDTNEWHDGWGRSVAIGDFDGDGYGDLAVGAPQEDHGCVQLIIICDNVGKGSVTVIYGNSSGLSNSTKRITQSNIDGFSNEANDRFGEYLAVGNFNGDGADDLAIGMPDEDITKDDGSTKDDSGAVVVLYGTVGSGLKGSEAQGWSQKSFDGASAEKDDQFGRGVVAGDFTGNGGSDLAVAAPGEDLSSGGNDDDGMVVVFYGTGDTSAPAITANISGIQGDNGIYTSDVTLSWTVDEPQSPYTLSTTGCGSVTVKTDTNGINYTCEATSAGGTSSKTVTILRDATPPVVDSVDVPTPNSNGWLNTYPTVTWHCSDATSGVVEATHSATLEVEGENLSLSSGCTDNAGNQTKTIEGPFNIDVTDPVIGPFTRTDSNSAGWNNTPVTFDWTCSDALSGPADASPTDTISTEGKNQGITLSCEDLAGNISLLGVLGINIDLTPPVAIHDGPYSTDEGTTIQLDGSSSTDALSGVASTSWALDGNDMFDDGDPASFTPLDGPARYDVKLRVVDQAGNETVVTTTVETANVPPTVQLPSVVRSSSNEAEVVTASISFSDPGPIDTHACEIDWGDGTTPTTGTVANYVCTGSHTYADDNLPGTSTDQYTVTMTVTDKDNASDSSSVIQTVNNVNPTIDAINVAATVAHSTGVPLLVDVTDPGAASDPLTYRFDCDGNGTYETDAGSANFTTCFPDQTTLSPTIGVEVRDDDLGIATGEIELYVEKVYCVNAYTGELRDSSSCGSGEWQLTLAPDRMTTFCAHVYTGSLTYGSNGCGSSSITLSVPANYPIDVCSNWYTGALAYRFGRACGSTEQTLIIPAR